jgi:acetoacetate decarboxylase
MPWPLRAPGPVLASLHWVEANHARQLVPPEFRLLRFLPGWTIGGLLLARYGPGSALEYSELVVGAATVWHGRGPALWVTDLFVDNPDSVEGGRTLLGAPKRLAAFSWEEDEVTVAESGSPICRVRHRPGLRLWRQRLRLVALHRDVRDPSAATAALHGQTLTGRWRLASLDVDVPEGSPWEWLTSRKPIVGLRGRDVELLLGGAPFQPLRLLPIVPPTAGQLG